MTQDDKKDDICICMYPHTRCPGHSSDTELIISLQKQVADLRKNAREIARRDLIAELKNEMERIYEKYHYMKSSSVKVGFIQCFAEIFDLLDSYDQK